MSKWMWTSILTLAFSFMAISPAYAQQEKRFKRGMATVVFSSLGGAVLGLSTLSFYSEPEEHANNVSTGAILGFIFGSGYVMMDSSAQYQKRQEEALIPEIERSFRTLSQRQKSNASLVKVAFEF